MKPFLFNRPGLKFVMLLLLALPEMAGAQFTDTENGDVDIGFRKTGSFQEQHEMVVYLGNFVTNILNVTAGTTVNITNYLHQDLTNMCPDNISNLQWSAFCGLNSSSFSYSNTFFPQYTCLYTIARTNTAQVTLAKNRLSKTSSVNLANHMVAVEDGGFNISQNDYTATNVYNNPLVELEPISDTLNYLTADIGDRTTPSFGDFGGQAISFTVENVTSNNFTTAAVSDFFLSVPASTKTDGTFTDPITGLTNGTADNLGYFTLSTDGTMTFTRASAATVPSHGTISSTTVTNGFGPLQVIFTNTASGTITQWIWNYGNGIIITNTTGVDVTNTYAAGGPYTVILTVVGPGGSASVTNTAYIVASPTPKISYVLSKTNLIISGTNCPVGIQYRILKATNLLTLVANWTPMVTNKFLNDTTFGYTNTTTNAVGLYRMVSP